MEKIFPLQSEKNDILGSKESDAFFCADPRQPFIFVKGPGKILSIFPNEAYEGSNHKSAQVVFGLNKIEKEINKKIGFLVPKGVRQMNLKRSLLDIFIKTIFWQIAQRLEPGSDKYFINQQAEEAILLAYEEMSRWDDVLRIYNLHLKKIYKAFLRAKNQEHRKFLFEYLSSYPYGLKDKEKKKLEKIKELATEMCQSFED